MKELKIAGVIENGVVLTKIETGSDVMSWNEFRMVVLEMIFNLTKFYFKKINVPKLVVHKQSGKKNVVTEIASFILTMIHNM